MTSATPSDRFRITLGQLNPTVGDISGNAAKARTAWEAGKSAGADLVALIKPQFEVGPSLVGKGGIVRDAVARQDACDSGTAFLKGNKWQVDGLTDSPITGSDGNVEYLVRARRVLP